MQILIYNISLFNFSKDNNNIFLIFRLNSYKSNLKNNESLSGVKHVQHIWVIKVILNNKLSNIYINVLLFNQY